jgi:hypothetical protein
MTRLEKVKDSITTESIKLVLVWLLVPLLSVLAGSAQTVRQIFLQLPPGLLLVLLGLSLTVNLGLAYTFFQKRKKHRLSPLPAAAIQMLAQIEADPDCTTETLAQQMRLSKGEVKYYRDELMQHGLIDFGASSIEEDYQIFPKGRKLLHDRQLL